MNRSELDNSKKSIIIKILFVTAALSCLLPIISGPVALIGGFLFLNLIGHPFRHLNQRAVNWLLKSAIVGLGFGINIEQAMEASKDGLFLTIISISIVLVLGYLLGRWLKMNRETSHLISSGTAICGGSAIAAVAPVINASEKDISISLGVVFLLNAVALFIFPSIGHYLELSQYEFGLWSALAVHDTSSVVGTAMVYGNEALKVATTVKLARTVWIIPLALISLVLFRGKNKRVKLPWFILLFIGTILANSYLPLPTSMTKYVLSASKSILVLTLFLVGAGLSIRKIKAAGWKPMVLGVSLWVMVSFITLVLIIINSKK